MTSANSPRAVIDASGTWWKTQPARRHRRAGRRERRPPIASSTASPTSSAPTAGATPQAHPGRRQRPLSLQRPQRPRRLRLSGPPTELHWAIRASPRADVRRRRQRRARGARTDRRRGSAWSRTGPSLSTRASTTRLATPDDGRRRATGATSPVDELIAATGFRPDLSLLSELRLALDTGPRATAGLAPLIDPNIHTCGIRAAAWCRGAQAPRYRPLSRRDEVLRPGADLPPATGHEQVRSIVAAIPGDWKAARRSS